jgi:hypothetical protein
MYRINFKTSAVEQFVRGRWEVLNISIQAALYNLEDNGYEQYHDRQNEKGYTYYKQED